MAGYQVLDEFDFDNLIAGNDFPVLAKGVTLAPAQGVVKRGTLIGIITASGLAVTCDNTKNTGEEVPKYILAKDTDTGESGATDAVGSVAYQSGIFNRSAIITESGQSIDTFEDALRENNIILSDTIAYPTV